MSKILNLSENTTDEDLRHLTTLLLYHLVEKKRGAGSIQVRGRPSGS